MLYRMCLPNTRLVSTYGTYHETVSVIQTGQRKQMHFSIKNMQQPCSNVLKTLKTFVQTKSALKGDFVCTRDGLKTFVKLGDIRSQVYFI